MKRTSPAGSISTVSEGEEELSIVDVLYEEDDVHDNGLWHEKLREKM